MANEKRLIDANRLKWKLGYVALYVQSLRFGKTVISKILEAYRRAVFEEIDNAPTVDAVEVVRCRDCVNYCGFEHCKNGICDVDSVSKRAVYPNDFCSYGERRTDV